MADQLPKLRLALQKSGRLSEESLRLIEECGIDFAKTRDNTKLKAEAFNFPLEILFLRDDDIPGYVADGVADLGIVGENVIAEKGEHVVMLERLGFSKCRLSIAVPRSSQWSKLADLEGCHIATSYPNILQQYLQAQKVDAEVHEISGSVEIAPSIGLAQAICDLVGTGSTLISNGLREIEVVLRSEAVLVQSDAVDPALTPYVESLQFRIQAVGRARKRKYILLNAPNERLEEITSLLPGAKSPTVMPLKSEGWSSVHAVVEEGAFWDIVENLKLAGAEGILVLPIEKMIP